MFIYEDAIRPTVMIYERMTGARLVGQASPGSTVRARLALRADSSARTFHYTNTTTADDKGRFTLIVPYPTERKLDHTAVVANDDGYRIMVQPPDGEMRMLPDAVVVTNPRVRGNCRPT